MEDDGEKLKPKAELTPNAKGALAASGGLIGLDVLTHAGPGGLLLAGIATWVMARHTSDFIYQKDRLLAHFVRSPAAQREQETLEQHHSFGDRLLGRHLSEQKSEPVASDQKKPFLSRLVSAGDSESNRMVDLAPDLQLDIDGIAGKATFICGIRRSGKTTLGVRIAEELGRFNMRMLIPDLKGDWKSCIKTLPNAVILGQGEATEENALAHGYAICEEQIQIIIDIPSYDDMNEVALVVAKMIEGVFLWERKHPQDRRLCAIFLDEAQSFLPQDVKDSIISDPEARDAMQNAYMRTIAIGGSLGLFPVIMTQRIAQTSNKVIGQPELLFLFKQTLDNDLKRYQNFTRVSTEQVRGLKQGQGIFVSYEGDSSIHVFHKRTSSDAMSATPRYKPNSDKMMSAPETRLLDENEIEEGWGYDETEQDPLPDIGVAKSSQPRQDVNVPPKYRKAYKAWYEDRCQSVRSLAEALGMGETPAYRLMREMDRLGLIQMKK